MTAPSHRSNVVLFTLMGSRPGESEWENAWEHATEADRADYTAALKARMGVLRDELDDIERRHPEYRDEQGT